MIAEMRSSIVIFLLLCALTVCELRTYVYIDKKMSWLSAQTFCRENYEDLATVINNEDNMKLLKIAPMFQSSWIGLNRTAPGSDIWQWSNGEPPSFFFWAPFQPNNYGGIENCVQIVSGAWHDVTCSSSLPFICSWRVVLVKENKTWDEALLHCRTYYTDLVSQISLAQVVNAKNLTRQDQAVSVWTGLRFINGQWFAVDNVTLSSLDPLPSCPAPRYRCGAYNTQMRMWENNDCSERLHFICY